MHNAEFGEENAHLLNILSESKPDIIAITGGLVDAQHTDIDTARSFVEKADRIAPVYYVTGNHEASLPQYDELKTGLEAAGVDLVLSGHAFVASRIYKSGQRGEIMAHILVVDDDIAMLRLVRRVLEKDQHLVTLQSNAKAVTEMDFSKFGLILLDVMMPEMDGFNLCNQIRDRVDCPIIFLTAKTQEGEIVQGLGLGADDYITKPFGTNELRARVNAHLRRDVREKKNSFSISGVIFRLNAKEAEINSEKVPLTKSEYEICEYLARHHGQTFTREQIYEAVFGFDGESDSSVISTHIKNIRGKLAEFHLSTIETIWGVGYKWV